MEDLLIAVLAKAYQKPALTNVFKKRMVIIDDENNLTPETMALGFPLLGIRDSGQSPVTVEIGGEDEGAEVEFHVFTQRFANSTDSMVGAGGIVTLTHLVRNQMKRDIDFASTGYAGPQIFEAEWIGTTRSTPWRTPEKPMGMKCACVIRYRRLDP